MMKPLSMVEEAERYQKQFEQRRHERQLGLAINQCLHGIQNVLAFIDPKLWPEDDKEICIEVKEEALKVLDELKTIERKLLSLADIYASLISSKRNNGGENPTSN